MEKINPLTGITLGGFQVFDELTYIPLDRLTFLFGPNSAGKSSIQDAIEMVDVVEADSKRFFEPGGIYEPDLAELIIRHKRKARGISKIPNNLLQIHVKRLVDHQRIAKSSYEKIKIYIKNKGTDDYTAIEDRWIFAEDHIKYEFYIDDLIFLSMTSGAYTSSFSINHKHQWMAGVIPSQVIHANEGPTNNKCIINDEAITFFDCIQGFSLDELSPYALDNKWLAINLLDGTIGVHTNNALIVEILDYFNNPARDIMHALRHSHRYQWKNVAASRLVPKKDNLTFRVPSSSTFNNDIFSINLTGEDQYRLLVESLAGDLIRKGIHYNGGWVDPFTGAIQGNPSSGGPPEILAINVNKGLKKLFGDQGYYISFDYRLLLSKENSDAIMNGSSLDSSSFEYIVQMNLKDKYDNILRFEDVGSGLGYILPVLNSLYSADSAGSSICFIQQPELHLHPALQATLGDVFIEGSAAGNQLLIETHSEHLLLRVLKRIRQTHQLEKTSSDLKLNANDVCILYFYPSPDDTTKVKHLRISESGEFMDRWPGGFFPERGRELLDE